MKSTVINKIKLLSHFETIYGGYDERYYTKSPRLNKDNFSELFHDGCGCGWGRDDDDKRFVKVWNTGIWKGEFVTGWHDAIGEVDRLEYHLLHVVSQAPFNDGGIIPSVHTFGFQAVKTRQDLIDYISVLKCFLEQNQEYVESTKRFKRNELLTKLLT